MDISARVQPKASRSRIEVDGAGLKIYVTAAPESGKANEAVIALLAKNLRVSKSSIAVVKGHTSRDKVLRVESLTLEELRERLLEK